MIRPTRRASRIAMLCATLLAACASSTERVYVAPSNDTVITSLEASYDGRGQQIYVTNLSSVPIVVTSLHLRECKNIRNRCEVRRMNVLVEPGKRRQIELVEYDRTGTGGSTFRYSWSWEQAEGATLPTIQ